MTIFLILAARNESVDIYHATTNYDEAIGKAREAVRAGYNVKIYPIKEG